MRASYPLCLCLNGTMSDIVPGEMPIDPATAGHGGQDLRIGSLTGLSRRGDLRGMR